jgi:cell division protein FtsX
MALDAASAEVRRISSKVSGGDFAELCRAAISVAAQSVLTPRSFGMTRGNDMIAAGFSATLVLSMMLLISFAAYH